MQDFKAKFDAYMNVKPEPNFHEIELFERARKYTGKIVWIPGIEMIAISNSLSMYATHDDSDIDLFIVTKPGYIWFVRFFTTLTFWLLGAWRRGKDIRGNFCLSFFITTEAMNLEKIAIENDVYLYYWVYYLKPIYEVNTTYERFLDANSWVKIPEEQKIKNQEFIIQNSEGGRKTKSWGLGRGTVGVRGKAFFGGAKRTSFSLPNAFGTFGIKSTKKLCLGINQLIRFFLLRRTLKSYRKLRKPWGVIIDDTMLKFHPEDRRKEICDGILEKNFDK